MKGTKPHVLESGAGLRSPMRFFRAIEMGHGTWTCRIGREILDAHRSLEDAKAHLFEMAQTHAPATLFAHWLDGRIEQVGLVPGPASG